MQKKRSPRYTSEFKERAVELSRERTIQSVAGELGVSPDSIVRWRAKYGVSPTRKTDQSLSSREMRNLIAEQQREIEMLRKEKKLAEWPCGNASLWSERFSRQAGPR